MRVGVVFPQTEIGADAGAVRAYAERVEGLGFTHLLAYDHVVGADPKIHVGWDGPYDLHNTFHEPLVTFGYLAAVTTSLELVTGIVPRPTPAGSRPRLERGRVRGTGRRLFDPR
jgi:alkanesulfonate monooxygenase SsuD/methylene tetrahydromethanopterin reductase-like flavin-dependent oxidoreductase (luciferase family)